MKKTEYKRREFLSSNENSSHVMRSSLEQKSGINMHEMKLEIYSSSDYFGIQSLIKSPEDAEEMMAFLAKIEDHARSLRSEIISIKFEQNTQKDENT